MCLDTGIIIAVLFWLLLIGVVCVAPIIFALVAFARWSDARQKRLDANER